MAYIGAERFDTTRTAESKANSRNRRKNIRDKRAVRELHVENILADLKRDFDSKLANAGRIGI